jgi:hypothetical protein
MVGHEPAAQNLTPIMSRVYPERKWRKERGQHREKPKLNRVTQILVLPQSVTKGKLDIRESVEKRKGPAMQDRQDRVRIF